MLAALEGMVRHLDKQVGVFTPQVVCRMIVDVLRKALSHAAQSSSLMLQLVAGVGNGQLNSGSLGLSASFALLSAFLVSPDIMAAVQDLGASHPGPAKQTVGKAKLARSEEVVGVPDSCRRGGGGKDSMGKYCNFGNKITCSLTSSLSPLSFGIVDSGASVHLTPTVMGLYEVEPWEGMVETAEAGEMLPITARGSHPVVPGYCYVVTGLGDALISFHELERQGLIHRRHRQDPALREWVGSDGVVIQDLTYRVVTSSNLKNQPLHKVIFRAFSSYQA